MLEIPKLIHFVWIGPAMPDWVRKNIQIWRERNLGYAVLVHGEEALCPDWREQYDRFPRIDNKSDFLRYSILREHGGWYVDADMLPLQSLDSVLGMPGINGTTEAICAFQDRKQLLAPGFFGVVKDASIWPEVDAAILTACPNDRLAVGPNLLTAIWKNAKEKFALVPQSRWWHCARRNDGRLDIGRMLLRGESVAHEVLRRVRRPEDAPYVLHVGGSAGSMPRPGFEYGEHKPSAVFLYIPSFASRLADLLSDMCEDRLVDARIVPQPERGRSYLEDVAGASSIVNWGKRQPGAWYRERPENFLFVENGLLDQRHGMYVDSRGYWTESSIVERKEWRQEPTAAEQRALEQHIRDRWGVEPFCGGNPDGPILFALQHRSDAPCLFHFPERRDRDSIEVALWIMRQFFRQRVGKHIPILVRPHPKFVADWRRTEARFMEKYFTADWQLDFSPDVYATLRQCRAVVTVNSTLATEALAFGIPVATLGEGTFTGAGVTIECAKNRERLLELHHLQFDEAAARRYLCAILRHQLPYAATKADVRAHPIVSRWLAEANRRAEA